MSQLVFNEETGVQPPETSAIREEITKDWTDSFLHPDSPTLNTESTSPAGQLIDSQTAIVEDKNAEIIFLSNMFDPAVSSGKWQEGIGNIYFIERKIETHTVVSCEATGLFGTVIPAGSIIKTQEGITLTSNDSATINTYGKASIIFTCTEDGEIPIAENTANQIVTVIPGWDTINNPTVGVMGTVRESRAEFERRRYASVATNAHGTVPTLYGTIANISGVLDVVILENISNDPVVKNGVTINGHSVFISVYGGDADEIAEAIFRKKDAGCGTDGNTEISYTDTAIAVYTTGITHTYRIERPRPLDFSLQVTMRKTATTPAKVEEDIKKALLANFNGADGASSRVRIASICYASRFFSSVISAGVQDLVSIKLSIDNGSSWHDEVTVTAEEFPLLSSENIIITIIE